MSILGSLKKTFGLEKKPIEFAIFHDPLNRFEIPYPKTWKFDPNIIVNNGEYTVLFQSNNATFSITVLFVLPDKFNFDDYAKKEFGGAHSGIYSEIKKTKFRKFSSYEKEYYYKSDGKTYFGREILFFKDKILYLITYHGLKKNQFQTMSIFQHMSNNLYLG